MAQGYRNNGGSLIVGLVQDYRNRAERKSVRAEEKAYRDGRDVEADKRWFESNEQRIDAVEYGKERDAVSDSNADRNYDLASQQNTRANRTSNNQNTEFERQQKLIKDQTSAKQLTIDTIRDDQNFEFDVETDAQNSAYENQLGSMVGRGASGTGTGVEVEDNGDGTSTVGVGSKGGFNPFTDNPHDQKSSPMLISNNRLPALEEHVAGLEATATQNGFNAEKANAYVRAGVAADPQTGLTDIATPEQMGENLKRQGFLAPDKAPPTKAQVTARDKALGPNYVADKAKYKQMLADDEGTGDFEVIDRSEMRTLKARIDAKEDQFKFPIKPSEVNLSQTGVVGLEQRKEAADEAGKPLKPTQSQIDSFKLDFTTRQAKRFEDFRAKKQRDAAVANEYLVGLIDKEALLNYTETGDERYSKNDLVKQFGDKVDVTRTVAQINKLNSEIGKNKSLDGAKLEKAKNAQLKSFNGQISALADVAATAHGDDDYTKQNAAQLKMMIPQTVAALNMDMSQMNTAAFQATMLKAMEAALSDKGYMKGSSFTGYLNSSVGKIRKQSAAQAIGKVYNIQSKTMSQKQVLDKFDEMSAQARKIKAEYHGTDALSDGDFDRLIVEFTTQYSN